MPDADYIPIFPNLIKQAPYGSPHSQGFSPTNNKPGRNPLPSTPEVQSRSLSFTPTNNNSSSLKHVKATKASLHTQNDQRQALQADYEAQLEKQRQYYLILEQQVSETEPKVMMWKRATAKALGLVAARDRRIEDLERRVEALEAERVMGQGGVALASLEVETGRENQSGQGSLAEWGADLEDSMTEALEGDVLMEENSCDVRGEDGDLVEDVEMGL
jgi:hypothetical protein